MSTLWMLTVIFGAGLAATLALPSVAEYADGPVTARDLFRSEWLIVATFLVLPLYRAARLSWLMALVVVPIASVHVLYIADSAVDASQQAGLADGVSPGWYAVAVLQVGVFAVAGAGAAYRNFADRRWVRRMRSLTARASAPGPDSAVQPGYPLPHMPTTRRRPPPTGRASS